MSDVVVRYEPRGAARELFRTTCSEVAIAGAAGTGKSLAALFRVHLAALNNHGIRCLIVRKTAVSLGSTTLVTYEHKVAEAALANGTVRWFGGSPREAASYRYSNGSRIVVGGLDKPEKVLSSEYDLIFCDEATELTITDWETLGTRLRNGKLRWGQQQIAACNPDKPTHWIKLRSDAGPLRMLYSRHADNPAYVNLDGTLTERGKDYMSKLDGLTGVRRLRLRDGKWAAAEGLIYGEYDPAVHLLDPFEIPESWPRFWSVDFGYTHAFVIQCWAEDPDGRLYLYREIYRTRRTVDQHAADILAVCTIEDPDYVHPEGTDRYAYQGRIWTEPRPSKILADHDAEGRAVLERELGMSTEAAKKTVTDGIQAVQARLRPAGDGRPRLYLLRDAVVTRDPELQEAKKPCCTAEEILGYVWDTGGGKKIKEAPLKQDDDGCDAARYLVADRDLAARPRVRTMG